VVPTFDCVNPIFERSEADGFLGLVNSSSPEQLRRFDVEAVRIGGVAVLSMPGPDASFWCQAVGFTESPSADLIGEIVDHYRDRSVAGARFVLPPYAETAAWDDIARKYGLVAAGRGLKLAARLPLDVPAGASGLRVARVEPADAERWSTAMWDIFGMAGEANIALMSATLHRPEFEAYACWDGDEIVATGLVRLHPDAAHLFSGATRPAYRGRGAQSALIAVRVEAAQRVGCPLVIAETGVVDDGYNTSARNLIRVGFTPQYDRTIWMWTA